jgi:GT2 family glycosyltransferase/glycosyltransferase involved in cell wall biosynthesis
MSKPRTLAEQLGEQASEALRRGEAARVGGDLAWARVWLERAKRLAPSDLAIAFALASLRLGQAEPGSADLFEQVTKTLPIREAWLGLAVAQAQAGKGGEAAVALRHFLSHFILPSPFSGIAAHADAIATMAGEPGWCGIAQDAVDGSYRWIASCKAEIRVDGHPLRRPALRAQHLRSAEQLTATINNVPLLGSPINLAALRASEGAIALQDDLITGWAWHPADPDTDPRLDIRQGRRRATLIATDVSKPAIQPLTRPRFFAVALTDFTPADGPVHVHGPDGRALLGSPVDPWADRTQASAIAQAAARAAPAQGDPEPNRLAQAPAPAALKGHPATAASHPDRPAAIVVPIYRHLALTQSCLASVFATVPPGTKIIVVDDATPEPALAAWLDILEHEGRITLLRHAVNRGFPASANAGLRHVLAFSTEHDVILLNSDTQVPKASRQRPNWLERLRAAVHSGADIGTAAPFSNDATILSYPERTRTNPPPDTAALAQLDARAWQANGLAGVEIPTSVGFCMYVRHECAIMTGIFREDLFAQGYGEENDFCLRARHLGWRHVAMPGVFVAHRGATSFGAARVPLIERNLAVLERLHPGYHSLIAEWQAAHPALDALAPARRALDRQSWRDGLRDSSVILITHDSGGGVERVVRERCAAIAASGQRAVVLRPVPDPNSSEGHCLPGLCRVSDGATNTHPNLIYHLPTELTRLTSLLRLDRPLRVEIHHRLGHDPSIADLASRLKLPTDIHVHDLAAHCPRITLVGMDRRYCGEPEDIAVCEACIADAGSRLEEAIPLSALRARSAREFAAASAVVVPSSDMAKRLARHFPQIRPIIAPLEADETLAAPPPMSQILPRRVCVIGAIGVEKGYDVLLACARDAARRDLPLEFILAGHSTDDDRLFATGRVFITGRYDEPDGPALVRGLGAHMAFLPSIWPETWGFTLGLAWRCGLRATVFDIGAMAARVRNTGHGWVLPLGLSAQALNNHFLAPR